MKPGPVFSLLIHFSLTRSSSINYNGKNGEIPDVYNEDMNNYCHIAKISLNFSKAGLALVLIPIPPSTQPPTRPN